MKSLAERQADLKARNCRALGRKATDCPGCGKPTERCITGDYATIDCAHCNYHSPEVRVPARDARRLAARQKKMYQGQ